MSLPGSGPSVAAHTAAVPSDAVIFEAQQTRTLTRELTVVLHIVSGTQSCNQGYFSLFKVLSGVENRIANKSHIDGFAERIRRNQ